MSLLLALLRALLLCVGSAVMVMWVFVPGFADFCIDWEVSRGYSKISGESRRLYLRYTRLGALAFLAIEAGALLAPWVRRWF